MLTNFIAVSPDIITDFEKGVSNRKTFINCLKKQRILSCGTFEVIDYILTDINEDSPFTIFTGEGEILSGADGKPFMFEWIDYGTKEKTKYIMQSPSIYKNDKDLEKAVKISLCIERDIFEEKFNFRDMENKGIFSQEDKIYVEENKDEIVSTSYEDFVRIRKFYHEALKNGKYVILFFLSRED